MDDFNCNLRDLTEIRRKNSDPYSEAMLLNIMKDLLEGIQYLQRVGLCHRNLRPENICFSHRKAKYMINNLNLSTTAKNRYLDQVSFAGCLLYMPIEMVTNLSVFESKLCFKIDHEKYDIYSLAVIILELIAFKLVCRDLLEANAFYLFMRVQNISSLEEFTIFAKQKIAFHNFLINILKIASENRVISEEFVWLVKGMLDINCQVRIECSRALQEVHKLRSQQRKVFENEESDLQYSKYFSKQCMTSFKLTKIRNIEEYEACKTTAEFLTHCKLYFKACDVYKKLVDYLNDSFKKVDNGSRTITLKEKNMIKIKQAGVLSKLNRN